MRLTHRSGHRFGWRSRDAPGPAKQCARRTDDSAFARDVCATGVGNGHRSAAQQKGFLVASRTGCSRGLLVWGFTPVGSRSLGWRENQRRGRTLDPATAAILAPCSTVSRSKPPDHRPYPRAVPPFLATLRCFPGWPVLPYLPGRCARRTFPFASVYRTGPEQNGSCGWCSVPQSASRRRSYWRGSIRRWQPGRRDWLVHCYCSSRR